MNINIVNRSTTSPDYNNISIFSPSNDLACPPQSNDSYHAAKLFNFGFMMLVAACGIVGNVLVITTFRLSKRVTSATIFLEALACFDILLICCISLFQHRYAYTKILPQSLVSHRLAGKITIGILPIAYMCQSFSTWTVTAVALDRYIHVCHPLKASKMCKVTTAKRMIAAIVVISILYNIPRFFEYYKILQFSETSIDHCTGYFSTPDSTLGADKTYQISYAFGLYMLVMYAVPLTLLGFFNGNLIRKLKSMRLPGRDGRRVKLKGSDKIVPSLIIIVSMFTICQIPDVVLQILWRTNSQFAPSFSVVAYDFIVINSSVNFVIYVLAADGFRRSLMKLLGCRRRKTDSSTSDAEIALPASSSLDKYKIFASKHSDSTVRESDIDHSIESGFWGRTKGDNSDESANCPRTASNRSHSGDASREHTRASDVKDLARINPTFMMMNSTVQPYADSYNAGELLKALANHMEASHGTESSADHDYEATNKVAGDPIVASIHKTRCQE